MGQKKKVTLSFSGCGFLGIYHVGVATAFREFEEHFEVEKTGGASAGSIAAASYLCGVCLGKATSDVLNIAAAARASPVGPLSPRFNLVKIIRNGLTRVLPENAHEICSGRLYVSLTRCHDGKNLVVSKFASKEELIQRYWDGGITNNLPLFDDSTITVSPFSGACDICPTDSSAALLEMNFASQSFRMNSRNVYRLSRALFPPHPSILNDICKEGYVDACRYIQNILLRDVKVPSSVESIVDTTLPSPVMDEKPSFFKSLLSVIRTKVAKPSEDQFPCKVNLPNLVSEAFREACAATPHPAMLALSYITIPWVLPLEFMYSTCTRLVELTPRFRTMELEYYVEIFSAIAQNVAVKLLSQHRAESCPVLERHTGEIQLIMGDALGFNEVVTVMEQHDADIVEYFANLIKAPQPPLIISTDDVLAVGVGGDGAFPAIQLIADQMADSLVLM